MERRRIRRKWQLLGCLLLGLSLAAGGTAFCSFAFRTDSGLLQNRITEGHNTTSIVEVFPEQTVEPGENADIRKQVWIENEKKSTNVTCYVRARISYSSSDLGAYEVKGMAADWHLAEDGYYYYSQPVPPGEKTEALMTGLKILSGETAEADENKREILMEELEIQIYEESCQAKDPETQKLWSWKEAWYHALNREVKLIEA